MVQKVVDAASLRNKILCGYQGWFRCPGDASGLGWVHWSRDAGAIRPETLTFEMWPDMGEYGADERFPVPGFTYPDGRPAALFSSDNAATVLRHFRWMRGHDIDGAWLQHFLVDLPGGPVAQLYPSRLRVLRHVMAAAGRTGRAWALAYDIAGMPADRIYDVLTADWKRMVASGVARSPRYLREGGRPVVLVWGFYRNSASNAMSARLANRLIDFFGARGPCSAFLVGGGDWDWRSNPDPAWRAFHRRFGGYVPWNVGNYSVDQATGVKRASTGAWAGDRQECERQGVVWIPTVYPGFGWDNLTRRAREGAPTSAIPRRGGRFLWEQFHELAKQGVGSAYVAMFDEVDEGTSIFKVTSSPPTQARFSGYEGLPSDWYLRLVGEGARMLRGKRPITAQIPITADGITGNAVGPRPPPIPVCGLLRRRRFDLYHG